MWTIDPNINRQMHFWYLRPICISSDDTPRERISQWLRCGENRWVGTNKSCTSLCGNAAPEFHRRTNVTYMQRADDSSHGCWRKAEHAARVPNSSEARTWKHILGVAISGWYKMTWYTDKTEEFALCKSISIQGGSISYMCWYIFMATYQLYWVIFRAHTTLFLFQKVAGNENQEGSN